MSEVLLPETVKYCGPAADVWSFGATLYMLICQKPPWVASSHEELSRKVRNDELTFPKNIQLEPRVRHLLIFGLQSQPRFDLIACLLILVLIFDDSPLSAAPQLCCASIRHWLRLFADCA